MVFIPVIFVCHHSGHVSSGVQISKDFNKRLSLNGGFEHTVWRANLKMGDSHDDYADFDFYFTNVAVFNQVLNLFLAWKLS